MSKHMLHFLVIDDELFVAAHIDDLLSDEGLDVIGPVGTLVEAVLLARDEPLDGALLDVNIVVGRVHDVADILSDRNVPFLFVTIPPPRTSPLIPRSGFVLEPKAVNLS